MCKIFEKPGLFRRAWKRRAGRVKCTDSRANTCIWLELKQSHLVRWLSSPVDLQALQRKGSIGTPVLQMRKRRHRRGEATCSRSHSLVSWLLERASLHGHTQPSMERDSFQSVLFVRHARFAAGKNSDKFYPSLTDLSRRCKVIRPNSELRQLNSPDTSSDFGPMDFTV